MVENLKKYYFKYLSFTLNIILALIVFIYIQGNSHISSKFDKQDIKIAKLETTLNSHNIQFARIETKLAGIELVLLEIKKEVKR